MIGLAETVVIFICLFVFYKIIQFEKFRKSINTFPGPKRTNLISKLLGNGMDLSWQSDILFEQLRKLALEFKETYALWGAHQAALNLVEPDDIEKVLSSMKYIEKGDLYAYLHPWLQEGLLTSAGTKWQQRRKILTPTFHFNILKRFLVIMNEHSEKLVQELKEECLMEKTNIVPLFSKSTLNIICETAMGTTLISTDEKQINYRKAIYGMAPIVIERILKPWLFYETIFNLTKSARLQRNYLKTLHSFTNEVIAEREKNFTRDDVQHLEDDDDEFVSRKKRLAMLDLLISAKKDFNSINDEGIREEVDTFMFEGHDTSSMALCFIFLLIANHKDVQDKIYQEIIELSFESSDKMPTPDELQNMRYLDMVIKECLRLYPSVPFISRRTDEQIQLKNGVVPVGCNIFIHIYDLHHNPRVFREPEKFNPDRFSPENCRGRHPYAYIPFSAGPRNCIGQRFAQLEIKTIVCSVLKNFILEPVTTPRDLNLQADLVLRSKDPIYIKFRSRL